MNELLQSCAGSALTGVGAGLITMLFAHLVWRVWDGFVHPGGRDSEGGTPP